MTHLESGGALLRDVKGLPKAQEAAELLLARADWTLTERQILDSPAHRAAVWSARRLLDPKLPEEPLVPEVRP